jgi:hypothetical protein
MRYPVYLLRYLNGVAKVNGHGRAELVWREVVETDWHNGNLRTHAFRFKSHSVDELRLSSHELHRHHRECTHWVRLVSAARCAGVNITSADICRPNV